MMNGRITGAWLGRVLVVLLLLAGCRSAVSSPDRAAQQIAEAEQLLAGNRGNAAATYYLAALYARGGREGDALRLLGELRDAGLGIVPDAGDFPALKERDGYRAIEAQMRAAAGRRETNSLAFTLREVDLIPEGIAYDEASGAFFVSSIRKRKVVRVALDGTESDFVRFPEAPLFAVLGMHVDPARRLLWVASFASKGMVPYSSGDEGKASLVALSLGDGTVVSHDELSGGRQLLNDIAVAPDGTIYVTNSEQGSVYRKKTVDSPLEPFTEKGSLIYPNGIALSEDSSRLYVAHFPGIVVVDCSSGKSEPIREARGVTTGGIDGLSRSGDRLIAVMNGIGEARIVAFRLSRDGGAVDSMETLDNSARFRDIPTTGALADGAFFVIANSHLRNLGENGILNEEGLRAAEIVRVPF